MNFIAILCLTMCTVMGAANGDNKVRTWPFLNNDLLDILWRLTWLSSTSSRRYDTDPYSFFLQLNIDIFYESRCPDSRDFMQNQLKKSYQAIKDRVNINYVPFGKARVSFCWDAFFLGDRDNTTSNVRVVISANQIIFALLVNKWTHFFLLLTFFLNDIIRASYREMEKHYLAVNTVCNAKMSTHIW